MHERRFSGDINRLRSPARREMLEVDRVVNFCLEGMEIQNMLDVGTGSGLFAEAFTDRGIRTNGIDVNIDMAATAKMFIPQGEFIVSTAEGMPFVHSSFDLVFMALVWHETDDLFRTLQEAKRLAIKQVAILEWTYLEGTAGPPMADRINPERAASYIETVGFSGVELMPLANTVLYRLNI
jgi:ubiquinone/menaquinone biosynthesis C-methylase UbiE